MTEIAENRAGLDVVPAGRRRSVPRRRPWRRLLFAAAAAVAAGLVVGFVGFVHSVVETLPPTDPRADGIVVLTGGAARIDGALQLLAEGRADRLLISGVNPAVTGETLAATVADDLRSVLACCVDLDHARDTIENAAEAKRWAGRRGFSSLIVVTSDYHMPRSMAELAEAMPDTRLVPYPVSNPDLHLDDWWRDPQVFGLLAREYGKYLLVEARTWLSAAGAGRTAN
jgi:uncharacterized SAM-binding protein YcdF (DUF218 family)